MAETTYTYSIAVDVTAGSVTASNLVGEIQASAIVIAVERVDTAGDVLNVVMKDALSAGDETILDGLVAAHDPTITNPPTTVTLDEMKNIEAALMVEVAQPRTGMGMNFYSPNVADKCTWWEGSTYVQHQTMTDSGDQLTYNSPDTYWIIMEMGKLFREDNILASHPTMKPVIEVSDDAGATWTPMPAKTMDNFMVGDVTVNFAAGTITFDAPLDPSDMVRCSYHKAGSFVFTIGPNPTKRLKVYRAEMQFTRPINIATTIRYQVWGYNPFDLPNKIMYSETAYKSMADIIQESLGSFPEIPAMGGERGFTDPVHIMRFEYPSVLVLNSSQGLELRVAIDGDIPFVAEFANTTIYCVEDDE